MNQLKPLIWTAALALVVLSVFLAVSTRQSLRSATTMNTISFSGQGRVTGKPDIALVEFSIVTEALTSKAAQDQNSAKSRALTEFLGKQGIAAKDIKTSDYNIHPVYSYATKTQQLTGYQVTQSLELKIRDFDKASTLIDGIVSAGVNQVNQLHFAVENPEDLKDQARVAAINDAKAKANKLANQLGMSLGRIVRFSENEEGRRPPMLMKAMGSAEVAAGPSLPVGENEVNAAVTITYQID
jgi:uncharacterized protein YggE